MRNNSLTHTAFIWFYLPSDVVIAPWMLNQKRQTEISTSILNAIQSGKGKVYQIGVEKPKYKFVRGDKDAASLGWPTNVVLRYHSEKPIRFKRNDQKLFNYFVNIFNEAERLYLYSDSSQPKGPPLPDRQIIIDAYEKFDFTKITPSVPVQTQDQA